VVKALISCGPRTFGYQLRKFHEIKKKNANTKIQKSNFVLKFCIVLLGKDQNISQTVINAAGLCKALFYVQV